MPAQRLGLTRVGRGVGERVPHVGVLGHQSQGLAFALPADQDRDLSSRGRVELAQPRVDPRQCRGEVIEAAAGGTEFVAVFVVVLLHPARSDAEDQPPAGDVVDGAGHVGQEFGVAVGVATDQCADVDPRGLLGPRAEHGPTLVVGTLGIPVERIEVVPVEYDVDAEVLAAPHGVADLGVVGRVLRLKLDTDADGESHDPYRKPRV